MLEKTRRDVDSMIIDRVRALEKDMEKIYKDKYDSSIKVLENRVFGLENPNGAFVVGRNLLSGFPYYGFKYYYNYATYTAELPLRQEMSKFDYARTNRGWLFFHRDASRMYDLINGETTFRECDDYFL